MELSIILNEYEKNAAENYARRHCMSLEEALKKALFEKIEDEYDIAVFEEAYSEYMKNPTARPFDELVKELGI